MPSGANYAKDARSINSENNDILQKISIQRTRGRWTKYPFRFLRISRPGVRVPSIAPKNAVRPKGLAAFLVTAL